MSKVRVYKPKTKIPKMIEDALRESNFRKSYEWQHDQKFVSDGIAIEVIKYDIETFEYCYVLMNGKKERLTKRSLRQWWEERDKE